MNVNDLSAKELARIDAICLDYEVKLRKGTADSIDTIVKQLGGKHAAILRSELDAVAAEISIDKQITRAFFAADGKEPDAVQPSESPLFGAKVNDRTSDETNDEQVDSLPKSGRMVGPYLLGEVLGRGGMGVVLKATDTRLDRQVAIKMFAVSGKHKKTLTERFQREAKSLAGVSHPNIVELFDVGIADGVPFAVMEYLQGESLADRLGRDSLSPVEVRRLGASIADALTAAHASGVIHRDLKPHNIMLVKREGSDSIARRSKHAESAAAANFSAKEVLDSGEPTTIVKLIDFGLSRQATNTGDNPDKTRIGTIMGTPGYMSPEQTRGEEVTSATDIFGLGCVLFEAFYGRRAFDGVTSGQRFAAVLETTPTPDLVRCQADPALGSLIERCLAKRIDERPRSAAEIARELRSTSSDVTDLNKEFTGPSLSRRRFVESIAGAFAGAIGSQLLVKDHSKELRDIRSIAVVSLSGSYDANATGDVVSASKSPVGVRGLSSEEQIAGMIAQELQRVPNLKVRPFRPIIVRTPEDFVKLGRELDVDAILTGLFFEDQRGTRSFVEITLQLVSSKSGEQIWTNTVVAEKSTSLLEQTELVAKLVGSIDQRLNPRAKGESMTSSIGSFGCLAKGHTYLDADNSIDGLEMAIACFNHAISQDGRYPDAHAGLALTQIAIATRGNDTDANVILERIRQARDKYVFALDIDPKSYDARLAKSILSWQTMFEYDQAHKELMEIASERPNDWRIRYQLGLLETTQGEDSAASMSLLFASQLNPQSLLIRTDLARLQWFSGLNDQAIKAGRQLLESFPSRQFAEGLLVDIYEELGEYPLASQLLPVAVPSAGKSREEYFAARKECLGQLPYGPFGAILNQSIFEARRNQSEIGEDTFSQLADAQLPALSMPLNRHPTFESAKKFDRAKAMLV